MRIVVVRRGSLALLHDYVDRPLGVSEAGDRAHTFQVHHLRPHLARGIGEKQRLASQPLVERAQVGANGVVKVADSGVILRAGHQPRLCLLANIVVLDEGGAVLSFHPLRSFKEDEVLERLGVEAGEPHGHARREVARRDRECGTAEMRPAPDRHRQVGDDHEVPHLLDRNVDDRRAPALQRLSLALGHAKLTGALQAEGRVEVAAHQRVLDFSRLRQQMQQLLA